jgi:glycosyltransferase A (GT-A) superfamily protein (DUF2064 family)
METQFGLVPPWQAGDITDTLAVQVIALVQSPAPLARPATLERSVPEAQPAVRQTLDAVLAAPVARRVVAIEGAEEIWPPPGFELVGQRGGNLGERMAGVLADAHAAAPLPMLLIRADTLGVTSEVLADAARSLVCGEADAAFGPSSDGRFWLLGLSRPDRSLVIGINEIGPVGAQPGRQLLDRLALAGFRVAIAPRLAIADPGA